jgi:hypothetical protein
MFRNSTGVKTLLESAGSCVLATSRQLIVDFWQCRDIQDRRFDPVMGKYRTQPVVYELNLTANSDLELS